MTPEQQRIAIAEVCGWRLEWQGQFAKGDESRELLQLIRPDGTIEIAGFFHRSEYDQLRRGAANYIPDYLNDLNAMHEAEKVLTIDQSVLYVGHVYEVIERDEDAIGLIDNQMVAALVTRAAAAQRAEAFLRTLGRWVE